MKTIILLLAFTTVMMTAMAQQDSVIFEHCLLRSSGNIDSRVIRVKLDFGTGTDAPLEYLKEPETAKPMKFNSIVDALNYLGKKGWELVYVTASPINALDLRYFLKRRRVVGNQFHEK